MAQERVQRQKQTREQDSHTEETNVDVTNEELAERTEETLGNIDDVLEEFVEDDLLADLDEVLGTEEEAEQLVADFVQAGGE